MQDFNSFKCNLNVGAIFLYVTSTAGLGSGRFGGSTQGGASTSRFSSGGTFSKLAAPAGGFGMGSSLGFDRTQPPAGFFFSKSGVAAGAAPTGGTGLFGKDAPASALAVTGLFGKETPASAPTGKRLFGKPAVPCGSAGAGEGLFGQSNPLTAVDSTVYTPLSELTPEEKEWFEADTFTIGKIPTRPPPIELVR